MLHIFFDSAKNIPGIVDPEKITIEIINYLLRYFILKKYYIRKFRIQICTYAFSYLFFLKVCGPMGGVRYVDDSFNR